MHDSEGGFAEGVWTRNGDQWVVKMNGVTHDGHPASSTNILTHVAKDRMTWQSRDRVVGDEIMPNVEPIVVVRKAPTPNNPLRRRKPHFSQENHSMKTYSKLSQAILVATAIVLFASVPAFAGHGGGGFHGGGGGYHGGYGGGGYHGSYGGGGGEYHEGERAETAAERRDELVRRRPYALVQLAAFRLQPDALEPGAERLVAQCGAPGLGDHSNAGGRTQSRVERRPRSSSRLVPRKLARSRRSSLEPLAAAGGRRVGGAPGSSPEPIWPTSPRLGPGATSPTTILTARVRSLPTARPSITRSPSYWPPRPATDATAQQGDGETQWPVSTPTAPADQAAQLLDAARDAFAQGDYAAALTQCDKAIAKTPSDTVPHEFRALALFALHRYTEAAASLYAVLSIGPGWDWTTMSSLYPDANVYTEQLRALEKYVGANPNSADARFVLAYQYLTCGHTDAAAAQFKAIVRLNPKDQLSAQILGRAGYDRHGKAVAHGRRYAGQAGRSRDARRQLEGETRRTERPLRSNLSSDGKYTWTFAEKDKPQAFSGDYTVADNLLVLKQGGTPVMVGQVTPMTGGSFNFKLPGNNPDDPGLTFGK